MYLIDDAQIFADSLIDQITRQARSNRKVLFSRTISDTINFDSVLLTKKDAVDVLYKDFLARKNEIWPIVKLYDNTIGVGFS